jgi:hypothetical protein
MNMEIRGIPWTAGKIPNPSYFSFSPAHLFAFSCLPGVSYSLNPLRLIIGTLKAPIQYPTSLNSSLDDFSGANARNS